MPGPAPIYCPKFPEEFLQQARYRVGRKTAPYRTVQRYQLVLLLENNPRIDNKEAGLGVGLSADQVRRWRKRWCSGDFSVEDLGGRGRKAVFSPARSRRC